MMLCASRVCLPALSKLSGRVELVPKSGQHVVGVTSPLNWQHQMLRSHRELQRLRRYFYFGNRTSELITADLAERSPFTGRSLLMPGLTLDRFVNVCIALNAWTTYPVLVVVLQVGCCTLMSSRIPCLAWLAAWFDRNELLSRIILRPPQVLLWRRTWR